MNQRVGGLCTGVHMLLSSDRHATMSAVVVPIEPAGWLVLRRNRARGCREGRTVSFSISHSSLRRADFHRAGRKVFFQFRVRLEKFVPAGYSPSLRNSRWWAPRKQSG
jgi:hypothetical protein